MRTKRIIFIGKDFDMKHKLETSYRDLMRFFYEKYPEDFRIFNDFLMHPSLKKKRDSKHPLDPLKSFDAYQNESGHLWDHLDTVLHDILLKLAQEREPVVLDKLSAYIQEGKRITSYATVSAVDAYNELSFGGDNILWVFRMILADWVNSLDDAVEEAAARRDHSRLKLLNPWILPERFFRTNDLVLSLSYTGAAEEFYGLKHVYHLLGGGRYAHLYPLLGYLNEAFRELDSRWPDNSGFPIWGFAGILYDVFDWKLEDIEPKIPAGTFKKIHEVIVLGTDYSETDLGYFKKIKEEIPDDAKWTFAYGTDEKKERVISCIEQLGLSETGYSLINNSSIYLRKEGYYKVI